MRWTRRFKLIAYVIGFLLACQLVIYLVSPGNGSKKTDNNNKEADQVLLSPAEPEEDPECTPRDARVTKSVSGLLKQIRADPAWWYIVRRIEKLWPEWRKAAVNLHQQSSKFSGRKIKQVLVVPGVLLGTDFSRNSSLLSGGPQGDLLQWADLIAALHVLGHNVTLEKDFYQAGRGFRYDRYDWRPKPKCKVRNYDLVYADIIALKTFPDDVKKIIKHRLRVVDAYGTEAAYNEGRYSLIHSLNSLYGRQNLNLRQFFTFYPHSPDNSFLGFVVPPGPYDGQEDKEIKKENIGVLYGKDASYILNKTVHIELLMQWMEIHATVNKTSTLPYGIVNHGVLSPEEYHKLLRRAKFFIGLELPLESSGVMEALHQGCVFINPSFSTEYDTGILQREGKPTSRKMTSQVPYLEKYVGEPYVITVSAREAKNSPLWKAVQRAYDIEAKPMVPHEFTMTGFLERLNAYMEHQKFGPDVKDIWPPVSLFHAVLGLAGASCTNACEAQGLICEPTYFDLLNKKETFENANLQCPGYVEEQDIHMPAFRSRDKKCLLQKERVLYSCAGEQVELQRLCPCRPIHKQQTALCEGCY